METAQDSCGIVRNEIDPRISKSLILALKMLLSGRPGRKFLDPLREVVAKGKSPAAQLLDRYHGEWNGDVSKIYDEMSF